MGYRVGFCREDIRIELAVYMVKISYEQKPYRRSLMQTWGAQVIASPSMSTKTGRKIITDTPNYQGSLGTAISEAIELAIQTPNCKYALGSVLNHVSLHQTLSGWKRKSRWRWPRSIPTWSSAASGEALTSRASPSPSCATKSRGKNNCRFVAAEPASCPKLTRGEFRYDFGDETGPYRRLSRCTTLGHKFAPANIHAGGLRYHGAGSIVSQLLKDDLIEAVSVKQLNRSSGHTLRTDRRDCSSTGVHARDRRGHSRGAKSQRGRNTQNHPV